jgi:hypothetical protein
VAAVCGPPGPNPLAADDVADAADVGRLAAMGRPGDIPVGSLAILRVLVSALDPV